MNFNQWIVYLQQVYTSRGHTFDEITQAHLEQTFSAQSPQAVKESATECRNIVIEHFFDKASRGEVFGNVQRIKSDYGKTVEENYQLTEGPFLSFARTYWTFKIEVMDLLEDERELGLQKVLSDVESMVAGVYFPTSGPVTIPVETRIQKQRELLSEFAPSVDADRFISENPILNKQIQARSGCLPGCLIPVLGVVVVVVVVASILW